jgi:hypothetical protein
MAPVRMHLKDLKALEKVSEKIDTLTVFGALDASPGDWCA